MLSVSFFVVALFISGAYVALIIFILSHWERTELVYDNPSTKKYTYSVIIPARNEERQIFNCLKSILENKEIDSLEVEIIVVDDHSTDATIAEALRIDDKRIKVLRLSESNLQINNAYKKAAINYGLKHAQHDYIVQFDADIKVQKHYFQTLTKLLQSKDFSFIAAPVIINVSTGLFNAFQALDNIGMMGVTQAGIRSGWWYMANGANMIYKKGSVHFDNPSYASGDDVNAIQQVASEQGPHAIYFAKDKHITVSTDAQDTLLDFVGQRIRWGTKNKSMRSFKMRLMMLIPYAFACIIGLGLFVALMRQSVLVIMSLCFIIMIKLIIDFIYLSKLSNYYNQASLMKHYLGASLLTIIYLVVIGTLSLFKTKYHWKGRRVS